jgi:hypothetical protein
VEATSPKSTSLQSEYTKPLDGRSVFKNTPATQPQVFPEPSLTNTPLATRHDQSVPTHRAAIADERSATHKGDTKITTSAIRIKRQGQVLGACAESKFRDCRGGDALEEQAVSFEKFDQFDRKRTRGGEGKGTCEGIVREAMRRIDRKSSGQGSTGRLPSAIHEMQIDMDNGRSNENGVFDRIDAFQQNRHTLGLRNHREESIVYLNAQGDSSRERRIAGLEDSMAEMPEGGLAYIRVGIQPGDAMAGQETSGHALLVQYLPGGKQYAIFDPNNGVFTYDSRQAMLTALRNYMNSAFTEDGNSAAPDTVQFYAPPTSRGWGSLSPSTEVPMPANPLPEPTSLLHHFGLGSRDL